MTTFCFYITEEVQWEIENDPRLEKVLNTEKNKPTEQEKRHKIFIPAKTRKQVKEHERSRQLPPGWLETWALNRCFHGEQDHIWSLQVNFSQHQTDVYF